MNYTDPHTIMRALRTLQASIPTLGRKDSADQVRLDLLRPDPSHSPDTVTERLLLPVRHGGAWRWCRLFWRFDGDSAVLAGPGFPTVEELIADQDGTTLGEAA